MVPAVRNTNLALRFALELTALAAVGWWGWDAGGPLLALAAVAAVVVIWGAFVAPKASHPMTDPVRLLLEVAVFGSGVVALSAADGGTLAVVFGVLVVVHLALTFALGQRPARGR